MCRQMLKMGIGCIGMVTLACVVASAQEISNPQSVATLAPTTTEGQRQAPASAAADIRLMWSDAAIQNAVGLAENAWDFNAPDGVPGFGPLPAHEAQRSLPTRP